MRTIRASELGTYIFCKRAWWFQSQGLRSTNQAELSAGSEFHRKHGRSLLVARALRLGGLLLLLVAVAIIVIGLTLLWLQ
jgi:hypothetical protein